MKNELILVFIVAILLFAIGLFIFGDFNSMDSNAAQDNNSLSNSIHVGNIDFKIPNNYKKGDLNKNNHTTITNGNNTISFSECNKNSKSEANSYVKDLNSRGYTEIYSEYDIGNTTVYKVGVKKTPTVHYWFNLDNKGYTIYSWDQNDLDDIVVDFINSY